jgi:hypothetical protein
VSKFAAPLVKDPEVKRLADAVTTFANSVAATYVTKDQLNLPTTAQQIVRNAGQNQTPSQTAAVLDLKNQRTTEGIIKRILENSGTEAPIQISSPYLFRAGGSKTNVWIGAGGIGGMYTGIPTWGIDSQTGGFFFGRQDKPSNQITFDSVLGELVLGSGVRLLTIGGETLSQFTTRLSNEKYTDAKLSAAMAAGVNGIVAAATNKEYVLEVTTSGLIATKKGTVYNGNATGSALTGLVMNAAGIAMGFNDQNAGGAWKNAVYIGATGNFVFGHTAGRQIYWDADAGEMIFGSDVRLSSAGGRTVAELLVQVDTPDYTNANLKADLAAGVNSLIAGIGGDYVLNVDTTKGLALFQHRLANYNGLSGGYTGNFRTMLGITANGISAGYNDKISGAFVPSFSIDAVTGDASFSGRVNATSGSFTGSIQASSGTFTGGVNIKAGGALYSGKTSFNSEANGFWLSGGDTPQFSVGDATSGIAWNGSVLRVNGTLAGDIVAGALAGSFALQSLSTKLNKNSNDILSGQISFESQGAFKVTSGPVTVDGAGNVSGGGTGVLFTAKGLVGWNGVMGKPSFTIGVDGSAVFSGQLDAATGSFSGTVNASSFNATGSALFQGLTDVGQTVTINNVSYPVIATATGRTDTGNAGGATRVGLLGIATNGNAANFIGVAGISQRSGGFGGYFLGDYGLFCKGGLLALVTDGNAEVRGNLTVTGAISGSVAADWSTITGKPTNVSYFSNDAGYVTSSGSVANATTATSATTAGSATTATTATNLDGAGSIPSTTNISGGPFSEFGSLIGYVSASASDVTNTFTTPPDGYFEVNTVSGVGQVKVPYWN